MRFKKTGDIKTDPPSLLASLSFGEASGFVVQTGRRNRKRQVLKGICLFFMMLASCMHPVFAEPNQTYEESFETRPANATVHGVDGWTVTQGVSSDAVVQTNTAASGSQKALALAPAETVLKLNRSAVYGTISPAWVDMTVRPGIGAQDPPVPSSGIGAVNFSSSGILSASDQDVWVPLDIPFDPEAWYRVLMKVNLAARTYDVYISEPGTYKTPFVPDRAGLRFIDNAVSSLNSLGFSATFKKTNAQSSYADNLRVHFVERVQIITPVQELVKGRPSEPIWIQLHNSNAEPQEAFEEVRLELRTSSEDASFSEEMENWVPITFIIMPLGEESVKVYYKDERQGNAIIQIYEEPDRGWLEATQDLTVKTAGNRFIVSTTASQIAGQPFSVSISARDEQGVVDQNFQGTLEVFPEYLMPLFGRNLIMPAQIAGFQEGVVELFMEYPDAGLIEIVVRDQAESESSGSSGPVRFLPHAFTVSAETAQIVGRPFDLTVQARNVHGDVTPNFAGEMQMSVVPKDPAVGGVLAPAAISAGQFQSGAATLQATYSLWGTVQVKVQDPSSPAQQGLSGDITFLPKALKVSADPPPDGRAFFYIGETVKVKVQVLDFNDQPIQNFSGSLALKSDPDLGLDPLITFEPGDRGTKEILVAAPQPGNYRVTTESAPMNLAATSPVIEARDAILQVISTTAPVGSAEVEIELVDENGRRIRDSRVTVLIQIREENPNNSAVSSATERAVVFNNGVAKIDIANLEAETLTLIPKSLLGFKIREGTIIFGRIGKSGIGALMWWEAKDEIEKVKDIEQAAEAEEEQERLEMMTPKHGDSKDG